MHPVLAEYDRVFVTDETHEAVTRPQEKQVDVDLVKINALEKSEGDFHDRWEVPAHDGYRNEFGLTHDRVEAKINWAYLGDGFEAQVRLAAKVAKGEIDRVLMFQDPDDVYSHLPEAYALIRNCTLADVSLNINAGATLWAESEWRELPDRPDTTEYGKWRTEDDCIGKLLLLPEKQMVSFIAHDQEKERMSRFVYHYRKELKPEHFSLTGTAGTCEHAVTHLKAKDTPHREMLSITPAGAADGAGHGPTGGDVVIADEIICRWTREEEDRANKIKSLREHVASQLERQVDDPLVDEETHKMAYKTKPLVRVQGITDTVLFFIDHEHAQPHQADIHVLLRTCLHPAHGVHLLLNERTALEWGEMLHDRCGEDGGRR